MSDDTARPSAALLPFPTKRQRPYKSAWLDRRNPPENVRLLRPVVGDRVLPSSRPLPPTGYVMLALMEALRSKRGEWERAGGPDVFGELTRMLHRWEADPEVRYQVGLAINLVCAHKTGRWHAD